MSIAKSVIRRILRSAQGWLQEQAERFEREEQRFRAAIAYGRLNRKLLELHQRDGSMLRPSYTWGVLQAAHLGKALGYPAISVLEFGVAGGNGLVALETAALEVEQAF